MISLIVGSLLFCTTGSIFYLSHVRESLPQLGNPAALSEAVDRYVHDQSVLGRTIPGKVTLRTLMEKGYIRADEVQAFAGMEVTFFLKNDGSRLDAEKIRVESPEFGVTVLRADGSVQLR